VEGRLFHSLTGLGQVFILSYRDDGSVIPSGKLIDSGVTNSKGYTLNYNEYIVYNTNQVRMRYLLRVRFDFKY